MPYTMKFRDYEFVFNTFAEFEAFDAEVQRSKKGQKKEPAVMSADPLGTFINQLNENHRRIYQELLNIGGPVSDNTLRTRLNIESNNQLAGYIAGITRAAKKGGYAPEEVLIKKITNKNPKNRAYTYEIPKDFAVKVKEVWKD